MKRVIATAAFALAAMAGATASAKDCAGIAGTDWPAMKGYTIGAIAGGPDCQKAVALIVIRDADGTQRALVVPTDASCSFEGAWGEYGKTVKGADSASDGRANTQAMADAGSAIAKKALGLSVDGHADFFIPSRREAKLIHVGVNIDS